MPVVKESADKEASAPDVAFVLTMKATPEVKPLAEIDATLPDVVEESPISKLASVATPGLTPKREALVISKFVERETPP